jgi:YD repeat-containing protein
MRPQLILLSIACGIVSAASAQTQPRLPQVNPATPEAAAIAKYINYPVNYGTGLIDIEIPLYTLTVGDLTVPISIKYHASGLRPNENTNWVGLGWSLQAEPQITVSQQGREDFEGYLINNLAGEPSYPNSPSDWIKKTMADGNIEEEPDEFYYQLLTKSGKFFYSHVPRSTQPYDIVTVPYEPIKVSTSSGAWDIVDDNGNRYRFGKSLGDGTVYTEYTELGTTAWKGTEIISARTGDTISFRYHPATAEMVRNVYDRVEVYDRANSNDLPPAPCDKYPVIRNIIGGHAKCYTTTPISTDPAGTLQYCGEVTVPSSGSLDANSRLIEEIRFKHGRITFEKRTNNTLASVKVYDLSNQLMRSITFTQTTFPVMVDDPRTRLDKIEIRDGNESIVDRYSFAYNNRPQPSRTTRDIDYWGYSNEQTTFLLVKSASIETSSGSYSPYPSVTESVTIGGGGRGTNTNAVQAGILTKITYPSGGYTEFTYEANSYLDQTGFLNFAGGLRIAAIRDYDPVSGKSQRRAFRYGQGGLGAGFIKRNPSVNEYMIEQTNAFINELGNETGSTLRLRTYYSSSLTDMFFSGGAAVVYDQVREYILDASGDSTLGKTIYRYNYKNNASDTPARFPGTTIEVNQHRGWQRGQLLAKEVYDANNVLVSKTMHVYDDWLSSKTIPVGKVFRRKNLIGTPTPASAASMENIMYYAYSVQTGVNYLKADTVITVGQNGVSSKNVTTYTYDNVVSWQPTKIEMLGSDGRPGAIYRKYPHDVTLTGPAETARQQLVTANQVDALLEETYLRGNTTLRTKTHYGIFSGRALPESIVTNTGLNGTDETRITYHEYDAKGNLKRVSKASDGSICYLWGYKNSHVIAEVKNATLDQIAYTGFESDKGGWTYSGGTSSDEKTGINSYNGTSITKTGLPVGDYVVSFWAKRKSSGTSYVSGVVDFVINVDGWRVYTTTLRNVSSVTLNLGNVWMDELRLHPVGAEMRTFTYTPLVGVTAVGDAANTITVFDYDKAGRLNVIRNTKDQQIKTYNYYQVNP